MSGKKPLSRAQIKKILSAHKKWLDGKTHKQGAKRADFRNKNISWTNFENKDLTLARFDGAEAPFCNFSGAILHDISFSGACLRNSTFTNTDISSSNFFKADLSGANFRETEIHNTDFIESDLTFSNFNEACIRESDFHRAVLRQSFFYPNFIDRCPNLNIYIIHTGFGPRIVKHNSLVTIGCQRHTVSHWINNGRKIARENGWSSVHTNIYMEYINAFRYL